MKLKLSRRAQNIIFTGLALATAAAVYLLSGAAKSCGNSGVDTITPLANQSSSPASYLGVPEDVFGAYLHASDDFSCEPEERERSFLLAYGESASSRATLVYTVDNGAISSLELTFLIPKELSKKDINANSLIEQRLYEAYQNDIAAQDEAVRLLSESLIHASDLNDVLSMSTLARWSAGAIAARQNGKAFEASAAGCSFLAYTTQRGTQSALIIAFYNDLN